MIVWLMHCLMMIFGILGSLLILSLIVIYFIQNGMVYVPYAPSKAFRYPESNPVSYRNPGERHMEYEDVTVVTIDKLKLKGWFVKQRGDPY